MATQTTNATNNEAVEEKKTTKKTASNDESAKIAKMNIFQKMLAVTAELQTVAKNLEVGTGNNKYKAVSERDVLDTVKPIEEKYGVYSYPYSREILESNMLESESVYNNQVTKKTTFMTRIMTVYRFVNVDNPSDYIETTTFSEGIDAQDKGSGKAMTYGDKYALMKAYKISTGDDPDASASEETNYTKTSTVPNANSNTGANKGGWRSANANANANANASTNANAKANEPTSTAPTNANTGATRGWANRSANNNANTTQNQTANLPKASGWANRSNNK